MDNRRKTGAGCHRSNRWLKRHDPGRHRLIAYLGVAFFSCPAVPPIWPAPTHGDHAWLADTDHPHSFGSAFRLWHGRVTAMIDGLVTQDRKSTRLNSSHSGESR